MKYVMMGIYIVFLSFLDKIKFVFVFFFLFRIIMESDPLLITQRVQLRQDDVPLGEQTVSQVSSYISKRNRTKSFCVDQIFYQGLNLLLNADG